jgi:hypothetical protein
MPRVMALRVASRLHNFENLWEFLSLDGHLAYDEDSRRFAGGAFKKLQS